MGSKISRNVSLTLCILETFWLIVAGGNTAGVAVQCALLGDTSLQMVTHQDLLLNVDFQ